MSTKKTIKEDPPELESKVDAKPVETEMFKEVAEKEETVSAKDFSALMEQNRILMAKLDAMTAGPVEAVILSDGKPIFDNSKPYASHRGLGYQYFVQNGNKFSARYKFLGKNEE